MVYLIHFIQPYFHARHYLGFTDDLARRLEEHQRAKEHLMGAINRAKIGWVVARVWQAGDRDLERKLKSWKGAAQFCPVCQALAGKESTAILPVGWVAGASPAEGICSIPSTGDFFDSNVGDNGSIQECGRA